MFGKVSGTRLDQLRRCEVLRNADRKLHVSFVHRVITVTGILIALAVPAAGQVLTSRVDGTVQDQSGAVIPGASVTLTNVDTNISLEAETNEVGLYVFPQAPAGPYTITTKLSGFKSTVLEGIQIEVDTPATIDIVLEVGVVDETVVVTASQPAMNTVNAEINTNLNREQVKELPLNGRSVTQLALTQAGVTSPGGARSASINGNRGTFNNFTLDGINNQDTFIRTDSLFGIIPLQESFIEEINITTANSEVDAGLGASQTQFVTRSGSNTFRGEAFYYNRNDALNANTFFNNAAGIEKEKVLIHQFGFNVGGPVVKDKLFFFFDYEQERRPRFGLRRTERPDEFRARRQFQLRPAGQRRTGHAGPVGTHRNHHRPGHQVADRFDAAAQRHQRGRRQERLRIPLQQPRQVQFRLADFPGRLPDQPQEFLHGNLSPVRLDTPNSVFNGIDAVFPGLPGAGQGSTRRLGSFSVRSTFTPTITNEARFGFQSSSPGFFTNETFDQGYILDVSLFSNPVQDFLPQGRDTRNLDLMDNLTWVEGNHTIKIGGSMRWTRVDSFNDGGTVPTYFLDFGPGNPDPLVPDIFPGGISAGELSNASGLLSTLGGFVDSADQSVQRHLADFGIRRRGLQTNLLTQNFVNLYLADTWRATSKLSLTFGVRWEFHSVPDEARGLALLPVGGVEAVLNPDAVVDLAGSTNGRPFFNNDGNNFAPNVGLAWQITDKTVLRAGYGLNYVVDNNLTTVLNALRGNDGLSQTVNLAGTQRHGQRRRAGSHSGARVQDSADRARRHPGGPHRGPLHDRSRHANPYVQQWNIGLQHQIMPDTAVELRYVGNHGIKLGRAVDLNQVLLPPDYIEDFRRAQRNLAANGHPAAGEPLQIIPQLGLGGFLQAGGVQNWIRNGEIGQYAGGFLAALPDILLCR